MYFIRKLSVQRKCRVFRSGDNGQQSMPSAGAGLPSGSFLVGPSSCWKIHDMPARAGISPPVGSKEDSMTLMNLRLLAARAGVTALVKITLFSVVLVAFAPRAVVAQPIEKKGTRPV